MKVLHNDKYLCDSNAVYGFKAESEIGMGSGGHSHGGGSSAAGAAPAGGRANEPNPKSFNIKTIASMTDCVGPYQVKKGDAITLVAQYDLKEHPLRKAASGASAADVMGMMGLSFAPGTNNAVAGAALAQKPKSQVVEDEIPV